VSIVSAAGNERDGAPGCGDPGNDGPPGGRSHARTLLKWSALGLLGIVALSLCFVLWLVNTRQGAHWALGLATDMLGEQLSIRSLQGTLAGPLTIEGLRYADPLSGLTADVEHARLDLRWLSLLRGVVRMDDAHIRGVRVVLGQPQQAQPATEPTPFSLDPPIDVVMERFVLEQAVVLPSPAARVETGLTRGKLTTGKDSAAAAGIDSTAAAGSMAGADSIAAAAGSSATAEAPLLELSRGELAGQWTGAGVLLQQLDVLATQGEVHFQGQLTHEDHYTGEGNGSFRWRVGEQRYAGELSARTQQERALLTLRLSAPLQARLDASLLQSNALPWRFELDVPAFDPRKALMPDSGMRRLAATLRGEGTLASGDVQGRLDIDGVAVRLELLHFTRNAQQVTLDPLRIRLGGVEAGRDETERDETKRDEAARTDDVADPAADPGPEAAGTLVVRGVFETAREPMHADVEVDWQDLRIPERWAGQRLHSAGHLQARGSMEQYVAAGQLAIGPPNAPVNVEIDIAGAADAIDVRKLALLQAGGELTARGRVELEPAIGWRLNAQAKAFDPGALVAGWPGQVSFILDSNGRVPQSGPEGRLVLQDLRGQLRGRAIAGRADLQFTAEPSLAGTLMMRSGESRIDLRAQTTDARGALDALAEVDVRSLGDWIPDAEGRLRGQITARGTWPALDVDVEAAGQALRIAQLRGDAFEVQLALHDPTQPSGRAQVELSGLSVAGFVFSKVQVQADGDRSAHRLSLNASGEQLSAAVQVEGTQSDEGWAGSIGHLQFDVPKVARLSLQSSAPLSIGADGAIELQQSCLVGNGLAGNDIRLCAALDQQADGALQASYELQGLELALANALAPDLPVAATGTIEGHGELRRTAQGELFGEVNVELPGGRIMATDTPDDALLEYSQLRLQAQLAGATAQGRLSGRLGEGGSLDGRVSLNGLGQDTTGIDGELSAAIPSLSPVVLFVPQLAEAKGRANLRVRVAGTLDTPQLTGELQASALAAQVPDLGLKLTDGRIRAVPEVDGTIQLDGEIHSGQGELSFEGRIMPDGGIQATMKGQDFLAADIPAARVIVAPDLKFMRDEQRMALTGEIRIPSADVDLGKLPAGGGGGGQSTSPDVVVIDDENAVERAQAVPLQADITIILGDAVKLAGFGLDAMVGGRLKVQERPGAPTTGTGEIKVAGTYKAYGQDLTIQRGQLLFANTPLDNPGLNIVAVRKVEAVTAGLKVEGTARSPQLSVFSDPAMTQSESLAYLVTGRPLDQIGSGEGDGDALQAAARSIGTAGGGLLAKSIGGRLGLDEVGVESNEMVGGATFTVGQYLSPRLYLSYGVGLFEPGEVINLRYRLTKALSLQTARGSNESRAGIEYRIER